MSAAGPRGAEAHGDPLPVRVPERAGVTYMPDRSWRALPGGQPAATQAQKHQSHSRQVTSAGRSGSCCRRGCARRATPAGKSEPGAEVGLAGQKLVCRARGAGEVRLAEEGAAAARQHGA